MPVCAGPVCLVVTLLLIFIVAVTHAEEAAQITVRPRDQKVKAGRVASFLCMATGDPKPEIYWRKNSKKLMGVQSRYSVSKVADGSGSVLRIEPVRGQRDDASYECVAENQIDPPAIADAVLTVVESERVPEGFPHISQGPTTKVVEIGHNAVLLCSATGHPTPDIFWVRDLVPVDMSDPRYSVLDGGALQIMQAVEDDQGKYECMAENIKGVETSQPAVLYVKVRRVPPTFSIPPPRFEEVMLGASLNLTCVAVGSPMPFVKWRKGEATEITPEDKLPVGRNVLELTDIRESANYTCIAASDLGVIQANTSVRVQSLPGPPTDVVISDVTATSVRLTWSQPVATTPNAPNDNLQYEIEYKAKASESPPVEIGGIITQYYVVRGLSPYTDYEFNVVAVNNIGRGPPSTPSFVTTGETGEE
ncbi:hypothetical protein B566_EDAN007836 [Ephemera danica]|nr:hypothetical protein B566_EDAN007836 [Ephemera danica]